jgi:hypothetical protein
VHRAALLTLLALAGHATPGGAAEWRGELSLQGRAFLHTALDPAQANADLSLSATLEMFHDWDDGAQRIAVTAFGRADNRDAARTHADLREAYWRRSFDGVELAVGVRRVFWGVTEALHLVDIVNQTDLVENPDTEDKLGQPMVQLTLIRDWGTWDLFALTGFRERTFPGRQGRLRPPAPVEDDLATFEASAGSGHVDYAVRYSHYLGPFDFAVSHFTGTARLPELRPVPVPGPPPGVVLAPHYPLVDQTGLELSAAMGNWLWKLEAIGRRDNRERFMAATGGFEWTLSGLRGSGVDLGLIAEYQYDERGKAGISAFDNDLVIGGRLGLNDLAGSEILLLGGSDLDNQSRFWSLEASRRLGQDWRLYVESRFFSSRDPTDPLAVFRNDDYWQIELTRFF